MGSNLRCLPFAATLVLAWGIASMRHPEMPTSQKQSENDHSDSDPVPAAHRLTLPEKVKNKRTAQNQSGVEYQSVKDQVFAVVSSNRPSRNQGNQRHRHPSLEKVLGIVAQRQPAQNGVVNDRDRNPNEIVPTHLNSSSYFI